MSAGDGDPKAAPFKQVDRAFRDGLKGFTDPYNMNNVFQHDEANQRAFVEAKRQVARDLTQRMLKTLTDEDFGDERYWARFEGANPERHMYRILNPEPHQAGYPYTFRDAEDPPPSGTVRVEATEAKLLARERFVAELVTQWAKSNNDGPTNYAIQQLTVEIFDLQDLAPWTAPPASEKYAQMVLADERDWLPKGHNRKVYEAFIRAQHEATQEWFSRRGITHVTVHRGFRFAKGGLPEWARGDEAEVPLRPLSSFSVAAEVAETFAHDKRLDNLLIYRDLPDGTEGVVIEGVIPVERILAFPRTGVGALSEGEVVVLGGKQGFAVSRKAAPSSTKAARPRGITVDSVNEDWAKVAVWDVRDADGQPVTTIDRLAKALGVSVAEAWAWLKGHVAGFAFPGLGRAKSSRLRVWRSRDTP